VEPNREIIEDLMCRYGYEEEAEIAYHIREARNRLFELLRAEAEAGSGAFRRFYEETFIQSSVLPHFTALSNLLARRVLARQFPEGWGFRPPRGGRIGGEAHRAAGTDPGGRRVAGPVRLLAGRRDHLVRGQLPHRGHQYNPPLDGLATIVTMRPKRVPFPSG